jgi:hypothetical protein
LHTPNQQAENVKIHVLLRCAIVSVLCTFLCLAVTVKTIEMVQVPLAQADVSPYGEQLESGEPEGFEHTPAFAQNLQKAPEHQSVVDTVLDVSLSTLYPYFFAQLFPFVFLATVVTSFWNSTRKQ